MRPPKWMSTSKGRGFFSRFCSSSGNDSLPETRAYGSGGAPVERGQVQAGSRIARPGDAAALHHVEPLVHQAIELQGAAASTTSEGPVQRHVAGSIVLECQVTGPAHGGPHPRCGSSTMKNRASGSRSPSRPGPHPAAGPSASRAPTRRDLLSRWCPPRRVPA